MKNRELTQAGAQDFERVRAFYRDAIDHTPEMSRYGRWIYGLHPTDAMIMDYIESGAMLLWEGEGEILCAFALTPCQGSDYHGASWGLQLEDWEAAVVHLLCVNPKYQHQGIGKSAMTLAVSLAGRMGEKGPAVGCPNTPAHRLYESLGFQRRGTAHWFTDNAGWMDFYLFEWMLYQA